MVDDDHADADPAVAPPPTGGTSAGPQPRGFPAGQPLPPDWPPAAKRRGLPPTLVFVAVGVVVGLIVAVVLPRVLSSKPTSQSAEPGPTGVSAALPTTAPRAASPTGNGTGRAAQVLSAGGDVAELSYSADGRHLVALAAGKALVWDAATGAHVATVPISAGYVALSPDGRTIAVTSQGHGPALWDLTTGKVTVNLAPQSTGDGEGALAFSSDGHTVAQVYSSGNVPVLQLWDITKPTETAELIDRRPVPTNYNHAESVAFSRDGKTVALGGEALFYDKAGAGQVMLWDVATRTPMAHFTATVNDPANGRPNNINNIVNSMSFNADGTLVAVAMYATGPTLVATGVQLWDPRSGKLVATLSEDGGWTVAFSPDGRSVAFGSADGDKIELWSVADRTMTTSFDLSDGAGVDEVVTPHLAFSPDGHTLAASFGAQVQLWTVG